MKKITTADLSENTKRDIFFQVLKENRLPLPEAEYKFHDTRKWRFDYAWPDLKIALEVEGGVWKKGAGRHNRPSGFIADIEKYNSAAILGWKLLRVIPQTLTSKVTIEALKIMLKL